MSEELPNPRWRRYRNWSHLPNLRHIEEILRILEGAAYSGAPLATPHKTLYEGDSVWDKLRGELKVSAWNGAWIALWSDISDAVGAVSPKLWNIGTDAILALVVREWCSALLDPAVPSDVVENLAKLGNEEACLLLRWKLFLVERDASHPTGLTGVGQQPVDNVSTDKGE